MVTRRKKNELVESKVFLNTVGLGMSIWRFFCCCSRVLLLSELSRCGKRPQTHIVPRMIWKINCLATDLNVSESLLRHESVLGISRQIIFLFSVFRFCLGLKSEISSKRTKAILSCSSNLIIRLWCSRKFLAHSRLLWACWETYDWPLVWRKAVKRMFISQNNLFMSPT